MLVDAEVLCGLKMIAQNVHLQLAKFRRTTPSSLERSRSMHEHGALLSLKQGEHETTTVSLRQAGDVHKTASPTEALKQPLPRPFYAQF